MLRALIALVAVLLAIGVYSVMTGGASAHAAAPEGPHPSQFGYALAAGAIALAATLLLSRPKLRFRR